MASPIIIYGVRVSACLLCGLAMRQALVIPHKMDRLHKSQGIVHCNHLEELRNFGEPRFAAQRLNDPAVTFGVVCRWIILEVHQRIDHVALEAIDFVG